MPFELFDRSVWICTIALPLLVVLRLVVSGLWTRRPYDGLWIMLATGIVRDLLLWPVSYDPAAYERAWGISLVALLAAQIFCCVVTYNQIAERRTRDFAAALSVAAALCALPLLFEFDHVDNELRAVILLYRWIDGSLAVLLIAGALQRNWRVPADVWLLISYFGVYGLTCLAKNLLPLQTPALDRLHFLVVAMLYAGWLVVLPRKRVNFPSLA